MAVKLAVEGTLKVLDHRPYNGNFDPSSPHKNVQKNINNNNIHLNFDFIVISRDKINLPFTFPFSSHT